MKCSCIYFNAAAGLCGANLLTLRFILYADHTFCMLNIFLQLLTTVVCILLSSIK